MTYEILIDGTPHRVELEPAESSGSGQDWKCRLDGVEMIVNAAATAPDTLSLLVHGRAIEVQRERLAGSEEMRMVVRGRRYEAEIRDPRALRSRRGRAGAAAGPKKITAPMPGKIVRLLVAVGDTVAAGQGVIVIEAMKMQNEIKAPKAGVVRHLSAVPGTAVNAGDVLGMVE